VDFYVSRCGLCNSTAVPSVQASPCKRYQSVQLDSDSCRPNGSIVKSGHYKYLLSAICPFTKYLVCVPIADKTAVNVQRRS